MSNYVQISNGHLSNIKAGIDSLVSAGDSTDGLEALQTETNALIGTDTSSSPLSLTALTRVQKDLLDTKLGSIQTFLDKDSGVNFVNAITNAKIGTVGDRIGLDTSASPLSLTALLRLQKDVIDAKLGSVIALLDNGAGNTLYQRLVDIKGLQTDKTQISQLAARTDITDDATKINLKCSAAGSLSVKMDDHASVVIQGVSDQANPFGTKKPLLVDTTGKLEVIAVPNVVRGTFTCTDGAATGLDQYSYSSAMDTLYHATIHFTLISSAGSGHGGIVLHGSNDGSSYVALQSFSIQSISVGGSSTYHYAGSFTSGHRYYKIQNNGAAMSSTTTRLFQAYS
tara:strand:+ start:713 stop:1732 length:1020 start_codon:yes stop_codon:yes gene_type:complete